MRHLDGHLSLQLVVVGQEDAAEAAAAQELLDPVSPDQLRQLGHGGTGGLSLGLIVSPVAGWTVGIGIVHAEEEKSGARRSALRYLIIVAR